MPTKIGHFEILSELSKSSTGTVYKANDPESAQTIALKAIDLSAFGEGANDLQTALLAEAENTKSLSSSNITPVFGAGEMDGQFCAAMEYVQGNSIATMVARKEGFSIWDLLDIGRQVCAGLDHAHSNEVFHYSLEPAKVMCGWDGTVKILSFGVSSVGKFTQHISGGIPSFLHYMSPEQIRGEALDGRSNLFTLGAIFYEMVTDRKAFDREDAESLRQSILESTPVPPSAVNPKLHPALSDLIMKALEKDPEKRYKSGRDLLNDLEKCKESKPQAAAKKPAPAAKAQAAGPAPAAKAAAQSRLTTPGAPKPAMPAASAPSIAAKPAVPKAPERKIAAPAAAAPQKPKFEEAVAPKAAAAAAGFGGAGVSSSTSDSNEIPELDLSNQFITTCVKATIDASHNESAQMSAAVADEPQVETFEPETPKIAVDPMMAEAPAQRSSTSFSEINELPPLKEVYVAPPPPPPSPVSAAPAQPFKQTATVYEPDAEVEEKEKEKPKVQPRVVAQKAIKEIKGVPPKLMLYSIAGAVVLILVILAALWFRVHSQGDDDTGAAQPAAVTPAQSQAAASQPAPAQSAPAQESAAQQPVASVEPEPPARTAAKGKNKKKSAPVAPAIIPGQMVVDSTPQGAQFQIDGHGEASWVTPATVSNLEPGQHSLTVSKAGYSTDTRSVTITSGNRSSLVLHLTQLMATLSVNSNPTGANVYIDGRDTGKVTPAQVGVDKGNHVVLVRKAGYLDETTNAQFTLGATTNYSPTLRALGNVDSIKTVGKMKKLFGGNGAQAGMATVSIHTQPKGAQIAINQHILDKNSPVDIQIEPGNYVVDITLSGYAPIHKVITADKGGKVVIDETMQPQ